MFLLAVEDLLFRSQQRAFRQQTTKQRSKDMGIHLVPQIPPNQLVPFLRGKLHMFSIPFATDQLR